MPDIVSMPVTPFQTIPYLMAYRRHFGRGKEFHRLRLNSHSKAFLMSKGRSANRLEWWGAGIADVGGAAYRCEADAQALWQEISYLANRHHGAMLSQIPNDSLLVQYAQQNDWIVEEGEPCPVLDFGGDFDHYLKTLGRNMRGQLRRYPKRLAKNFAVSYELAQDKSAVQQALEDLFRLHGKRWRARGQTGVLATPRRRQFHRDVCAAFLKRGWLRLWTLRCDGEAVCVLLNYKLGQKYFYFIGGFDPDWGRWSVGTCLFSHIFQDAIAEGVRQFDFLRGQEEYKYRYGAVDQPYCNLIWHHHSARGQMLKHRISLEKHLQHQIHQRFSAAARKDE